MSSLLLASALALSGGAGKPLPRRLAEPAPASGCEAFGPGFVRVGGSDTCVELGGAVRAEYGFSTSGLAASSRR